MGWEPRPILQHPSRRENGRVVREYIGGGETGAIISKLDAIERERRETTTEDRRSLRADLDEGTDALDALANCCDLLTRAALIVAGYRQHNRGEWRNQRVRKEATGAGPEHDVSSRSGDTLTIRTSTAGVKDLLARAQGRRRLDTARTPKVARPSGSGEHAGRRLGAGDASVSYSQVRGKGPPHPRSLTAQAGHDAG